MSRARDLVRKRLDRAHRRKEKLAAEREARNAAAAERGPAPAAAGLADPPAAAGALGLLRPEDAVWYLSAEGSRAEATVLAVHHDDVEPYYTVRLVCGRERETVASRLVRRSARASAHALGAR